MGASEAEPTAAEKAAAEGVRNLKARFPQHSEEAIRKALEDNGGHAGLASIALTQLNPP